VQWARSQLRASVFSLAIADVPKSSLDRYKVVPVHHAGDEGQAQAFIAKVFLSYRQIWGTIGVIGAYPLRKITGEDGGAIYEHKITISFERPCCTDQLKLAARARSA
jgi:hypothetical protein